MAMRYTTVPDSLRGDYQGRSAKDWTREERRLVETLLKGKTVFISATDADVNDIYRLYQSFVHKEGRKLARRNATYRNVVGFFVWLQPLT